MAFGTSWKDVLILIQFSTLSTSSNISTMLDGLKTGSRQHITLYVIHSRWITKTNGVQRSQYLVTMFVPLFSMLVFWLQYCTHPLSRSPAGSSTTNMFDNLLALAAAPKPANLCDELESYLSSDLKHIIDVLLWWSECQHMYPALSHMAVDPLTVPGM